MPINLSIFLIDCGVSTLARIGIEVELESFIRSQLSEDDDFVQECNKCFDSAINLFKDLKDYLIK